MGGPDIGSSTVVVNGDGELQYELNQQTSSFLTNTHLIQQGENHRSCLVTLVSAMQCRGLFCDVKRIFFYDFLSFEYYSTTVL